MAGGVSTAAGVCRIWVMGSQIARAPDVPCPPRYRWAKRLGGVFVVFLLAVVGLRVWFGYEAQRRFDAYVAELRARGEPVYPEEFDPGPIWAEENAADAFMGAAHLLSPGNGDLARSVATNPEIYVSSPEARQLAISNADAADLAARAAARPKLRWMMGPAQIALRSDSRPFGDLHGLGFALCASAAVHAEQGELEFALRDLESAECLVRRLNERDATISGHGISVALSPPLARTAEFVALRLAEWAQDRPDTPTPALRESIAALVRQFLDTGIFERGLKTGLLARRGAILRPNFGAHPSASMIALTGVYVKRPNFLSPPWGWACRPFVLLDCIVAGRQLEIAASDVGLPTSERRFTPMRFPTQVKRFAHSYFASVNPDWAAIAVSSQLPTVAPHRALPAVGLAVRLYELDHGRRPACLDELVPEYLPVLPPDPYYDDGRTVEYIPEEGPFAICAGQGPPRNLKMFYLDDVRPRSLPRPGVTAALRGQAGTKRAGTSQPAWRNP